MECVAGGCDDCACSKMFRFTGNKAQVPCALLIHVRAGGCSAVTSCCRMIYIDIIIVFIMFLLFLLHYYIAPERVCVRTCAHCIRGGRGRGGGSCKRLEPIHSLCRLHFPAAAHFPSHVTSFLSAAPPPAAAASWRRRIARVTFSADGGRGWVGCEKDWCA